MDRVHQRPISAIRRKLRGVEHLQCPAYRPNLVAFDDKQGASGIVGGIRSREDVDYARLLIGSTPTEEDEKAFKPDGWCHIPKANLYVSSLASPVPSIFANSPSSRTTSSWRLRGKRSQKTSIQRRRSYDLCRMDMFCKTFPEYAHMSLVA